MKVYLKIKLMSLAEEARIIRREEKRWRGGSDERSGLHHHRLTSVRREARSAFLAYGFLRGRPLPAIEGRSRSMPNWDRVQRIAEKYGGGDPQALRQRFSAWKEEGEARATAAR